MVDAFRRVAAWLVLRDCPHRRDAARLRGHTLAGRFGARMADASRCGRVAGRVVGARLGCRLRLEVRKDEEAGDPVVGSCFRPCRCCCLRCRVWVGRSNAHLTSASPVADIRRRCDIPGMLASVALLALAAPSSLTDAFERITAQEAAKRVSQCGLGHVTSRYEADLEEDVLVASEATTPTDEQLACADKAVSFYTLELPPSVQASIHILPRSSCACGISFWREATACRFGFTSITL